MSQNMLGIRYLKKVDVENLVDTAISYKKDKILYKDILKDKNIITIFFENSTRTHTSFEIAAKKMGAEVINIDYEKSSLKKGETDFDTIKNLSAMHPDAFVVRHFESGYPHFLSKFTDIPIINAGDGTNEHPSQAILDLITMKEAKGELESLNVCIIGDITNSRVARSHIETAKMFNWNLSFYGPKTMLPKQEWIKDIKIEKNLSSAIKDKDFIILLRIQLERNSGQNLPSLKEYAKFFGINESNVPNNTFLMHPGPVNRNVELSSYVMDNNKNILITKQVENGVFARMAVYKFCLI
jgi:aspartate carbamoyltransferase catalytic subunit